MVTLTLARARLPDNSMFSPPEPDEPSHCDDCMAGDCDECQRVRDACEDDYLHNGHNGHFNDEF